MIVKTRHLIILNVNNAYILHSNQELPMDISNENRTKGGTLNQSTCKYKLVSHFPAKDNWEDEFNATKIVVDIHQYLFLCFFANNMSSLMSHMNEFPFSDWLHLM